MFFRTAGLCLAPVAPVFAHAAVGSVDLSNYRLVATHSLPAGPAAEASAVTWNWNTGTLFVLGDKAMRWWKSPPTARSSAP